LGSLLASRILSARLQEAPEDRQAWVDFPFWAVVCQVWGATVLTPLWAERVTVQDKPTNEVEPLHGDASKVDRVSPTESLPIPVRISLFENLFVDSSLKSGTCGAQAASAGPLLQAVNLRDQPHSTIRTVDARLHSGTEGLVVKRA